MSLENDATPLLEVLASSPEIVTVVPETDVLIPSPAAIVRSESRIDTEPEIEYYKDGGILIYVMKKLMQE